MTNMLVYRKKTYNLYIHLCRTITCNYFQPGKKKKKSADDTLLYLLNQAIKKTKQKKKQHFVIHNRVTFMQMLLTTLFRRTEDSDCICMIFTIYCTRLDALA